MKNLNEIELHDGNLLGINLDQTTRSLTIHINYHPSGGGDREDAELKFTGVTRINQILDLELIQQHSGFRNISYWVTGETLGLTYIYLARGLISIASENVEFIEST